MDGRLNCGLAAQSAAHTKIRHLENQVRETIEQVDRLGDQVLEINNALDDHITQVSEQLDTNKVIADIVDADTVEATNVISDNVNTLDLTATTIEAETIDVDNLENVNVLHGKTVDVEKTIATIGQFTETQTTTANNTTTNTEELNVDGETNLTGQVNIDGNVTFTKDNGLSKLQGNYLEIDAANVVIDNKNSAEYALYVPGINGDALFGGSVAVQDTLAAKNLIVTEETFIKNLKLDEGTVLNDPVLENITETQELTDKALDIDENGKLVRKFVAGGSAGSVASALIANETRYNYDLLDKYKQVEDENAAFHIILSDTANYTFYPSLNGNAYLENNNGQRYVFEDGPYASLMMTVLSITHNNILYAIIPAFDTEMENVLSAELRKINLNNMQVEYSIDVSEYFAGSIQDLQTLVTWLPTQFGNVLSEDKPVLAIAGTNKYFDLVSGNLLTRDENFTGGNTYYLSKTDTWYTLSGVMKWATNNKYTSIEDAALIDTPYLENDSWIFDAPVFEYGDNELTWINAGVSNTLQLNGKGIFCRDENDNKVFITTGSLIFNDVEYATNLYNDIGYVVNEYIATTSYQVEKVKIDRTIANFTDVPVTAETITINDKATIEDIETSTIDAEVVKTIDAEIDGMKFYKGKWYDKIVGTTRELIDYVLDTTNKNLDETYKILYTGSSINFDAQFMPDTEIPNAQVVGTYKVYSNSDDNVSVLNFGNSDYNPFTVGYHLFKHMHFYGFETNFDVSNNNASSMMSGISNVHINNCTFYYRNPTSAAVSSGVVYLDKCNNVAFIANGIKWPTTAQVSLSNCNNVRVASLALDTNRKVDIRMRNCGNCFVAVDSLASEILFVQNGGGSNLVVHYQTQTEGTKIEPTYQNF
mgnify:CR=1 FL=1